MKHQSLVGKLLAGENITIVQKRVSTAAFDIKNRTLYLPIWEDMTPEINDMLICHEVSHALFTPIDYVKALDTQLKFKNASAYLNILEDVRVEKLLKRKYPGTKKSFLFGYNQLNKKDFFGAKNRDLASIHLMDKMNLYYKVGYDCGVNFTEDEMEFVRKADKTETIQDVIALAQEIFEFVSLEKDEEEDLNMKDSMSDSESFDDELSDEQGNSNSSEKDEESGESDGEGDSTSDEESKGDECDSTSDAESQSNENSGTEDSNLDQSEKSDGEHDDASNSNKESGNQGNQSNEQEIFTDSKFNDNAQTLVRSDVDYIYFTLADIEKNHIIPFQAVLNAVKSKFPSDSETDQEKYDTFVNDNRDSVNYLAKEFEMQKAASSYKRTQMSKNGSIDIKKLYAYQIKEDIFKKINITKDGKNHGLVLLLDWSGSMQNCIKDALDQVMLLAMFCRRINIPFQIFAFSDGQVLRDFQDHYDSRDTTYGCQRGDTIDIDKRHFFLMELFSNKMTANQFNTMIKYVTTEKLRHTCELSSTPLNESLIYLYHHMKKFCSANRVEKLSFVTITDGVGDSIGNFPYEAYDGKTKKTVSQKFFLKLDHGVTIEFDGYVASQTAALLSAIKIKYDCTSIGYHLSGTQQYEIDEFVRANYSPMPEISTFNDINQKVKA